MKIKEQFAHGGDVQFYLVDHLPTANPIVNVADKILARGETSGHCHIVTGDVELFKDPDGNVFAVVGEQGAYHQHYREAEVTACVFSINKNISNCDHTKDLKLGKGVYIIGIDQQYDPHEGIWNNNLD